MDANAMLSVCKMAGARFAFKLTLLWYAGKGQGPRQKLLQALRHHRKPHLEVKDTYSFCVWSYFQNVSRDHGGRILLVLIWCSFRRQSKANTSGRDPEILECV